MLSGECMYEDQLYDPLIVSWDEIALGEIQPLDLQVSPSSMSFAVDNNACVSGESSIGDLFAANDPHYAKVTVVEFFEADPPTDGVEIFEGHIDDIDIEGGQVNISCSGFELSISNKFSHEIVDIDTYPNADPEDVGKMLPQVYGSAKRVPFRAVDIGWYSTLVEDIDDTVTTIEVTSTEGFSAPDVVQIGSEIISFTGISSNQLTGCTRGTGGSSAATHDSGDYVVKAIQSSADYFYYIIGHAVNAIDAVYMENVRLKSSSYTAYTGKSGDSHPDYYGYACIEVKNLSSTETMGAVTADVEGWMDDASGSYTGTANALIERPDSIIKHILLNRCGMDADTINPTSYAAAKVEYSAVMWEVT